MSIEHISENISRIRKSQGYTIQDLASECGLSRQAFSKIENGKSEPKTATLIKLSQALKVDIKDILADPPSFQSLRFRSHKSYTKKELNIRQQIIYDVNRWLGDFNELGKLMHSTNMTLPTIKAKNPKQAAIQIREQFGLEDDEPVIDIIGLLENRVGMKFYFLSSMLKGFFGFSVGEKDQGPAIVINTHDSISIERKIFTVAHELGHLILHSNSYVQAETDENDKEEKEADSFAGYLLLPDKGFEQELEETKGIYWVDAVLHIKRKYKVSYLTVLKRLIELRLADSDIYRQFTIQLKKRHGISLKEHNEPKPVDEPVGLAPIDFMEDRLSKLVREAYEKELITLSRAKEILRLSMADMRELAGSWQTIHS